MNKATRRQKSLPVVAVENANYSHARGKHIDDVDKDGVVGTLHGITYKNFTVNGPNAALLNVNKVGRVRERLGGRYT